MAGGVAVIRGGGSTEVEVKEKKDRVDDAMHATKAAVGKALCPAAARCCRQGGDPEAQRRQHSAGINIVLRALESPIRQIAENSGVEGSIVASKVLENKSRPSGSTPRPSNMSTC